MNKESNAHIHDADFPPLAAAGESPAPTDPVFEKLCLTSLDKRHGIGDIRFGAPVTTFSKA